MIRAAAAALLLAAGASAAGTPPPALEDKAPGRAAPGWTIQGSSLLLYGEDGGLIQEHGLRTAEEASGGRLTRAEARAAASPDGRSAWHFERTLSWNGAKTKLLSSRRRLRLLGTAGASLWSDEEADLPEKGEPAAFALGGGALLYARRDASGWRLVARDWTGAELLSAGPFPNLASFSLSPAGRFATALWSVPDRSATHTFLDLKAGTRRDLASSELTLGLARVGDDGLVRSGRRVVLDLAAPPPERER